MGQNGYLQGQTLKWPQQSRQIQKNKRCETLLYEVGFNKRFQNYNRCLKREQSPVKRWNKWCLFET